MADSAAGVTTTSFGLAPAVRLPEPQDGDSRAGLHPAVPRLHLGTADQQRAEEGRTAAYNGALAKVFHQWTTLCTFTPTQAGNYYLQVRTNVAWKGPTLTTLANYNALTTGSYQPTGNLSNFAMYTQEGDDTAVKGGGSNRFAVRAYRRPGRLDRGLGLRQDVDLRQRDRGVADLQPDPDHARRCRPDPGLQVLRHR